MSFTTAPPLRYLKVAPRGAAPPLSTYPNSRFTSTQSAAPKAVGKAAARTAQRMPPLSFFIVRSVVEHGQCSSEKIITHAAVACVQPFAASTPRS